MYVDKVVEKDDGQIVAVAWREDFGNQTSRQREQITIAQSGSNVMLQSGPAEYCGSRVVRVGDVSMFLATYSWRKELKCVEGKKG